jgi:NitT/TauT family transport system substrate-binding protein
MKKFPGFIASLIIAAFIFSSAAYCEQARAGGEKKDRGDIVVRMGMLPIIDNLPFWIAREKGYFKDEGLAAELIFFPSAIERDSAFTARRIDAGVGDLLAVASLHEAGINLKAIAIAMGSKPGESRFAVLSAPASKIRTPEQLKNVAIGVSPNSIIEYATDRLLQHKGLKSSEIKKISVPRMPVRLELLLQGSIQAATLPDPLATLAIMKGAHIIADTMQDNVSKTVVMASQDFLTGNPTAAGKLLAVYRRAIVDIKANPLAFKELLEKQARVPSEVHNSTGIKMPLNFSVPRPVARSEAADVLSWMKERGLLKKAIQYEEIATETVSD